MSTPDKSGNMPGGKELRRSCRIRQFPEYCGWCRTKYVMHCHESGELSQFVVCKSAAAFAVSGFFYR